MNEDKKLEIDEGWKSQVEREKEALRNQLDTGANQESDASQSQPLTEEKSAPESEVDMRDLPPASLIMLISSLASQAMASMGQIPGDDGKPLPVNLKFARHFIDLIGVIEDKTRNNLTSDETSFLNGTLHHLRMQFVESSRR